MVDQFFGGCYIRFMPCLKLSLNILNWATALLASALALASLLGALLAGGDAYRLGHTVPAERLSGLALPGLAWQIVQAAVVPAIASVVFLIPSMLLVARNRPVLAAAFALAPYGPLIWFLWVVSAPALRQ